MGDANNTATINGDMPESSTLSHITGYPLVRDSIKTVEKNPYGKKAIDMTNSGYSAFVKPFLPYLETPYSYTKPYVAKVDQIGDSLLSRFDDRIPILKTETDTVIDYAHWPMKKTGETTDWAFGTWKSEYKKCGGDGYVAGGKACITTPLILLSDSVAWFSSFFAAKKQETKEKIDEKTQQ